MSAIANWKLEAISCLSCFH